MSDLAIMEVHEAQLYRRAAGTSEFGTPEGDDYAPTGDVFRCRLSWESGFETTSDRTGAKPQTRSGVLFVTAAIAPLGFFRRGDRFTIDVFPDRFFECQFNRLLWDFENPHHWEIDVDQVVGN